MINEELNKLIHSKTRLKNFVIFVNILSCIMIIEVENLDMKLGKML